MKTNEERNSFIEEVKKLRKKLTKDEIKQMIGEKCTGADNKGDPRALPDQMLESVTGGFDEKSDGYFTAIYACPKCNGAHAARITTFKGSAQYFVYWNNGCIEFLGNSVYFSNDGSFVGEIELHGSHERYTCVVVCYTQQGETTWFV